MKLGKLVGFYCLVGLTLLYHSAHSQRSSWIDFSKQYFKVYTAEDGIYQISFDQLQQANFPVDVVSAGQIQLFHRGVEQAIEVVDGGDNQLNPGDYINFFGIHNDGTLDRDLYLVPEAQPHIYHNLYSDTTAYFLTWSENQSAKRMSLQTGSATLVQPFHWREQLELLTTD